MIRAIIFDFGGVLVRMTDDSPRRKLAEQLGISLSSLDDLVFFSDSAKKAGNGEISVGKHWQEVGKTLGIREDAMPDFLQQYWSADDVNWELLEYIRGLRPKYKVGLLSNAWDDLRNTLHNRWHIDDLFDELVISAEVGMIKPDPRIFHLAVDRLGVLPQEAVFIDDMSANVQAACQEGLTGILYQNTPQVLEALKLLLDEG